MNPLSLLQAFAALKSLTTPAAVAKPGYTTTEFWATGIVSVWAAISPSVPAPYNILVPAVAVGVYTLARAIIKVGHSFGVGTGIPDLPALPDSVAALAPANRAPVEDRPISAGQ